jgi:ATP-dependent Clp protease ATP-binding subunit ClpA
MQQQIDDKLANMVLAGSIREGETVKVDLSTDGSELTLGTLNL